MLWQPGNPICSGTHPRLQLASLVHLSYSLRPHHLSKFEAHCWCSGSLLQAFVGLSVTEVVASSITVVAGSQILLSFITVSRYCRHVYHRLYHVKCFTVAAGTTMNYFLDDRINNAAVLFPGVGCFLLAACLGSWLHASNVADIDRKLGVKRGGDVIDRYSNLSKTTS